jgi:hypothetical protein
MLMIQHHPHPHKKKNFLLKREEALTPLLLFKTKKKEIIIRK